MVRHLKKTFEYYAHALEHRRQWFNFWFRLLVVAGFAFVLFLVWDFLERAFGSTVMVSGKAVFLNQAFFQWFVLGAFAGAAVVVLLMEGELILGFRKIAKAVHAEGEVLLGEKKNQAKKQARAKR